MILADKIIQLRKQFGWSQENLAEAMNVSRQSVSKWESANSIPDLNKILKLAEIFGVSTDYLLKDELEKPETQVRDQEDDIVRITLEDAKSYVTEKVKASRLVAKGVIILIYSVIPLFFMLGLSEGNHLAISEDAATLIGLVILLITAALGVNFVIRSNQYETELEDLDAEFELAYGVEGIYEEKLRDYKKIYSKYTSIAVIIFMLSVIPLLASGLLIDSDMIQLFTLNLLIFLVGIGVFILIHVSAKKNAYEVILKRGEFTPEKVRENKRLEKFAVFYWPMVVAIYLLWSFWTNDWHISWIVWPVAGVAFAGFGGLINMFVKDNQ